MFTYAAGSSGGLPPGQRHQAGAQGVGHGVTLLRDALFARSFFDAVWWVAKNTHVPRHKVLCSYERAEPRM